MGVPNAGQREALSVIEDIKKLWDVNTPRPPESARLGGPRTSSLGVKMQNGDIHSPLPPTPEEHEDGDKMLKKPHQLITPSLFLLYTLSLPFLLSCDS